jgi:L-threonylcarbamoyladenylate synthase
MNPVPTHHIAAAASALEAGELVVIPTERWYMICADATDQDACEAIFASKQRPRSKSLVFVAPSIDACEQRFVMHPESQRLAVAFWPGNLAMLLSWRSTPQGEQHPAVGSPALVTVADGPLGDLAAAAKVPVAATTVNISGEAGIEAPGPAITTEEVRTFLDFTGIEANTIIDGGVSPAANHLTIVDGSTPLTRLVRPGLVHERALAAVLGRGIG